MNEGNEILFLVVTTRLSEALHYEACHQLFQSHDF